MADDRTPDTVSGVFDALAIDLRELREKLAKEASKLRLKARRCLDTDYEDEAHQCPRFRPYSAEEASWEYLRHRNMSIAIRQAEIELFDVVVRFGNAKRPTADRRGKRPPDRRFDELFLAASALKNTFQMRSRLHGDEAQDLRRDREVSKDLMDVGFSLNAQWSEEGLRLGWQEAAERLIPTLVLFNEFLGRGEGNG